MIAGLAIFASAFGLTEPGAPEVETFRSAKYGLKADIPRAWPVEEREKEDRIFVALIPQDDPMRPGIVACELALAPKSLEEYRSRIAANAERGRGPGTLVRNELVKGKEGERLESVWEFRPPGGQVWQERKVRTIAHRQLYTFTLNVEQGKLGEVLPPFEALLESTAYTPPDTGADLVPEAPNRWKQREFLFSLELPEGWAPALAPSELALFFANGPADGIWSDNVLALARDRSGDDLDALAKELPEQVRREEPGCEVLSCRVVRQGDRPALELIVRTQRGPFSMTVLERRFAGDRFDYEVKYTVESKRFEQLAAPLRKSLESFREEPGEVPAPAGRPGA